VKSFTGHFISEGTRMKPNAKSFKRPALALKFAILSMAFLVGAATTASSQLAAVPITSIALPDVTVVAPPSSWYYDPYADGATTCPSGTTPGGPKCGVLIPLSNPIR
jgi:hypothetical protein